MKIVMVVDGMGVGGIERVCIDYTKLLLKLGHKITVINLSTKKNKLEKEFPSEVTINHFPYSKRMTSEQYAQLIKRNGFGRFIYPIIFIVLNFIGYFYKLKYRCIYHEKYDLAIAFSGHFNDLTFVANNFICAKKKLAWLHGAFYSYLLISDGYYNLYKKIRNLICLVDDAQEEALIYNHNSELKIRKLYNPTYIAEKVIDKNKVENLKSKYGKFLLMVSRFEYPHKDQYTVCDAFELLRKNSNDLNLVFIGSGPEEKRVKEYVAKKEENVRKHIYFLGTQTDVQNYYRAAYLLVHASVAGEGLPTVQLEALAYGLPQVVTDSKVGPREILGDNKYGLLSRVKDPISMADKIQTLLDDKDLYEHFVKLSSERIIDFMPKTIEKKLNMYLDEIMNE